MNYILKTVSMIVASVCLATMVYADTLKIIIPAGPDGSFNTRFQILKSEIENVWGDDVKFVYGDNCARGKTLVSNEKTISAVMVFVCFVHFESNPVLFCERHLKIN